MHGWTSRRSRTVTSVPSLSLAAEPRHRLGTAGIRGLGRFRGGDKSSRVSAHDRVCSGSLPHMWLRSLVLRSDSSGDRRDEGVQGSHSDDGGREVPLGTTGRGCGTRDRFEGLGGSARSQAPKRSDARKRFSLCRAACFLSKTCRSRSLGLWPRSKASTRPARLAGSFLGIAPQQGALAERVFAESPLTADAPLAKPS